MHRVRKSPKCLKKFTPKRYSTVSRIVENRRNRRILASLAVGFVLVSLLAILSFILYQHAEENRKIAEAQRDRANLAARIARSGRSALQGLMELDQGHVEDSILLGLASLDIYEGREAYSSLLTTIQQTAQTLQYLHGHNDKVRTIAYGTLFCYR